MAPIVSNARHNRSAGTARHNVPEPAGTPAKAVRPGDALASLGRRLGLTDNDIAAIDQTRDTSPAQPMALD